MSHGEPSEAPAGASALRAGAGGDGPLNPGVAKREVWAWAMYDFANSGYTTVILTAVFSTYFVGVVGGSLAGRVAKEKGVGSPHGRRAHLRQRQNLKRTPAR